MKKRRINKLVVPLTLKSVSLFSAFTVMTTSLTSCRSNKKIKNDDMSSSITTSSEDELTYSSEISEELTSSELEENNSQIESTTSNTSHQNSKPSSNITSSIPSNPSSTSEVIDNTPQVDSTPSTSEIYEFIPLTANNINDVKIFERAVNEVAKNTRGNFGGIWTYHYNEQKYTSYGIPENEFTYLLAYFNKDYLSDSTLNQLLGSYTKEDMKRYVHILGTMISFVESAKVTNNWNGLIIDNNILTQLTNIEKGYIEYKYNNNPEILKALLTDKSYSNPFVGYYLGYAGTVLSNELSNPDKQIDDLSYSLYWDKMEESEAQSELMYNRSHGKSKILE